MKINFLHTLVIIISDQRTDSKVILFSVFFKNSGYQIVQNLKKNQKNFFVYSVLDTPQDFLYLGVRTIFLPVPVPAGSS